MTSVSRRFATFTAHEKPVTGDIKMSFVGYDHIGWLKCDGRTLSTKDFNLLFQVIGYTFGGSGNTFNLPKLSYIDNYYFNQNTIGLRLSIKNLSSGSVIPKPALKLK
mgnify:CR=1 FL=1